VSDYRSGGKRVEGDSFNGGPMTLNDGMTTMSMSGTTALPRIAGLEAERDVQYFTLYPHVLIGLAPDYTVHYTLWPEGADRTRILCDLLFPVTTIARDDFDPGDVIEFWDTTNRQDWDLCEKVQRASRSRGARPGPYHPAEACVHAFDQWYVRTMRSRLETLAR
jgi:Rieske 2Fe-2S family protein